MELSKLYEQVTAAREDAVVRHPSDPAYTLRHGAWGGQGTVTWYFAKRDAQHDDNPFNICPVVDFLAEAAIGWHWLGLVKMQRALSRYDNGTWCVSVLENEDADCRLNWYDGPGGCESSPIEALAAYLLATAKEAK